MNEFLTFAIGLATLIYGANTLIREAKILGKKLGLSDLNIGLTIVAIGTSLPELVTSLISVSKDKNDVALGMIVGSNIINILLILGLGAVIRPLKFKKNLILKNWLWAFLAICLLFFMGYDSQYSRIEGFCLLSLFIFFIYSLPHQEENKKTESLIHYQIFKNMSFLILGIILLYFGGQLFLKGIISLMKSLKLSEAVIGLTLVGFSTNIPEITTTIISTIKKDSDILIGNILGSNIQNILMVLGGTALFYPFASLNGHLNESIYILIATTLLLLPIIMFSKEIKRVYGACLLFGFILFVLYTFYFTN